MTVSDVGGGATGLAVTVSDVAGGAAGLAVTVSDVDDGGPGLDEEELGVAEPPPHAATAIAAANAPAHARIRRADLTSARIRRV